MIINRFSPAIFKPIHFGSPAPSPIHSPRSPKPNDQLRLTPPTPDYLKIKVDRDGSSSREQTPAPRPDTPFDYDPQKAPTPPFKAPPSSALKEADLDRNTRLLKTESPKAEMLRLIDPNKGAQKELEKLLADIEGFIPKLLYTDQNGSPKVKSVKTNLSVDKAKKFLLEKYQPKKSTKSLDKSILENILDPKQYSEEKLAEYLKPDVVKNSALMAEFKRLRNMPKLSPEEKKELQKIRDEISKMPQEGHNREFIKAMHRYVAQTSNEPQETRSASVKLDLGRAFMKEPSKPSTQKRTFVPMGNIIK